MAETVKHSTMKGVDAHSITRWDVADLAARDALTPVEADLHKVCFVAASGDYYSLASADPVAWKLLSFEGGNPVVGASISGTTLTLTKADETTITISIPEGYAGNAIEAVSYSEMQGGLVFTFRDRSTQTVELPESTGGGVAEGTVIAASRLAPPEGFVPLSGQEYDTEANPELASMFNLPRIELRGAIEKGDLSVSSNVMARNIQFQSSQFSSSYKTLIPTAYGIKLIDVNNVFDVTVTEPAMTESVLISASSSVAYLAEQYSSTLQKMTSTGTVSTVTVSWGLYSEIEALYTVAEGVVLANVSKAGAANALIAIRESDGAVVELHEGGWYAFGNSTRLLFSTTRGLVLDNQGGTMYEVDASAWPPTITAKPGLPAQWVGGTNPSGLSTNNDTVYQTLEENGTLYYALPVGAGSNQYEVEIYDADTETLVGTTPPLTDVAMILHVNLHSSGLMLVSYAPWDGVKGMGLAATLWTQPEVGWEFLDLFTTPTVNSATAQCWHTGISQRNDNTLVVVAVGRDGSTNADRAVWRLELERPNPYTARLPTPEAPGQWLGWYVKAPAIAEPAPPR